LMASSASLPGIDMLKVQPEFERRAHEAGDRFPHCIARIQPFLTWPLELRVQHLAAHITGASSAFSRPFGQRSTEFNET
jgi:hypothetical protein